MSGLLIYNVKIYDRALTPEEIKDVYNDIDFELKYKRKRIKKERKEKLNEICQKYS